MKLKSVFKKAVATIEVAAMTLALVAGLSFADTIDVSAADGTLTLNEGTKIVSDSEEVLSFTAPESGMYYFYSETTGGYDPYANLMIGRDSYSNDDTKGFDFWIEAELLEGEECQLVVSSYEADEGDEYETTVYVCDEVTAKGKVYTITSEENQYVTVGEAYELTADVENLAGDVLDEIPEGYSVKWFKCNEDGEGTELEEVGLTYSIDEVTNDDLYTGETNLTYYMASIYEGDVEINSTRFCLLDAERSIYILGDYEYANVGDNITFTASAYNYDFEEISLEGKDNYTYKWYKAIESEYGYDDYTEIAGATSYSYTVTVTENDFCKESNNNIIYICELYIDGEAEPIASGTFRIYDRSTSIYVFGDNYGVSEGDDLTLSPTIYDYNDNEIDINDENLEFTWYTYGESDELIILGDTPTLTIENVTFESDELNYHVEVSYKGEEGEIATFYIYNTYMSFYGGWDEITAEIGESLTLEAQIFDFNDEPVTEFDESFSFEWYKVTYDELEDEDVYSEVLGTGTTYEIEAVQESDICSEDTDYVTYACKVYRDDIEVAIYNVEIQNKETYWQVDGEVQVYAEIGDKATFIPTIYDGYGQEIDPDSGRFSFDWYDADDNYLGSSSSYTIDSVAQDNFNDSEYGMAYYLYIYDELTDKSRWIEFCLYEKTGGDETPTTPDVDPTEPTTPSVDPTTAGPKETVAPTTKGTVKPAKPGKVQIKKVNSKKKSAKKVKLTLKKIAGVEGYQVAVYKTKKNAKKNKKALVKKFVKKVKVTIKSKKLKNKKKLYVRARAYVMDGKTKLYGNWSKVKRIKVK